MAVSSNLKSKSLQIVTAATDAAGDAVTATKTFSDVNDAATDEQLYNTAEQIHRLYSGELSKVIVVSSKLLTKTA